MTYYRIPGSTLSTSRYKLESHVDDKVTITPYNFFKNCWEKKSRVMDAAKFFYNYELEG